MITFLKGLLREPVRYAFGGPCAALLFVALSGCVQTDPYRVTAMSDGQMMCDPIIVPNDIKASGAVPAACAGYMTEHAHGYDLLFAEFDDQGWANNPDDSEDPILHTMQAGPRKTSTEFGNLKDYLDKHSDEKSLIITFVHGWKHNASTEDANVRLFRQVLLDTAKKEAISDPDRKVIGVFIGWRGDSLDVSDGLKSVLTFYDRKGTADKVSKGAIHEVIAYLSAYERKQNRHSPGQCDASTSKDCKVRSIFIGHSFGGLILYEAIAPAVLSAVIDGEVYGGENGPSTVERFGDLVLLINPAIEAVRFQPLFRSIATYQPKQYRAPLMVILTTDADDATGTFFPLGRFFSTFFERKRDSEQRDATLETIGHMKPYLTHYLHHFDSAQPGDIDDIAGTWPRLFDDGNVLYLCDKKYASYPVWNVETDKTVMTGHSDLANENLRNFVVSLIDDEVAHPDRIKGGPIQQIAPTSAQAGNGSRVNCMAPDNYDRLTTTTPATPN